VLAESERQIVPEMIGQANGVVIPCLIQLKGVAASAGADDSLSNGEGRTFGSG
jgi:hypothetical protein